MDRQRSDESSQRFWEFLDELASVIGHAARVGPMRAYGTGLLLSCERESVEVPDLIRDRGGDRARRDQRATSVFAAFSQPGRVVGRSRVGESP